MGVRRGVLGVVEDRSRHIHQVVRGVLAVLATTLPHGDTPVYGIGHHAGNASTYPYDDGWHVVHGVYTALTTACVCFMLVVTTTRLRHGSVNLVVSSAVVATALVSLQMCGTYLAYRSPLSTTPSTAIGLWLLTPFVLYAGAT